MAFDLASAVPVEPEKPKFDLATAKPVAAERPEERPLAHQVARAVGRTVRAGVQGITAPVNMVGDALGLRSSEAVRNALTELGLPEAEGANERIAEDVASGMAGAGGIVGLGRGMTNAGNALVKRVGEVLASAPGLQVASGATGPGAASVVREEGGGPGAQLAAGVAGAMVPAAPSILVAATRAAMRGGESGRQRVARNIETFEEAGAGTPTVGQATEGRGARAVESLLAKTPGSAGRIITKAESEAAGLGAKVDDMATTLSGRTGAAPAGRQIRGGLEQFVDDFKASSGKLYDELDRHMPKGSRIDVTHTREALDALNADIKGAPNVSQLFKNARIRGVQGALKADTETPAGVFDALPAWQKQLLEQMPEVERTATLNGLIDGKLPYEALKKLRTLVGNEISDSTIASDVPRSKWKALYAALSKDMAVAAREAGPKAEAALVRANNYHRAGMQRLEDVLGPILKKGDPEDIFQAAIAGTKEGATTISGVMKSLPPESRKVVAATMLRRLGKATPGQQNDLAEVFSSETFLTNWNKLSADSKRVLFAPLEPKMRADLDQIAKAASNIREGSKVFANPSGSGQVVAATSGLTAFGVLLATQQYAGAAAIAGGAAAANLQARIMTNPTVVHWLARTTRMPAEQLPAQLNNLFQQSLYMRGDERKDVREFIRNARAGLAAHRAAGAAREATAAP